MRRAFQSVKTALFIYIAVLFSGCDTVDGPYSEPVVLPATERKILLEDYTGHKCQGCPAAHDEAQELKDGYGDALIVVTVHASAWANINGSGAFTYDFRTPLATELYQTLIPATEP